MTATSSWARSAGLRSTSTRSCTNAGARPASCSTGKVKAGGFGFRPRGPGVTCGVGATYDRAISAYPANREADVVLCDGSTIHVRPVRADDEAAVHELFSRMSVGSRAYRFFSAATDLAAAAREMVDVDYVGGYGRGCGDDLADTATARRASQVDVMKGIRHE